MGIRDPFGSGQVLLFSTAPYGYVILRSPELPHGAAVVDEIEAEHVWAMHLWVPDESLSGDGSGGAS